MYSTDIDIAIDIDKPLPLLKCNARVKLIRGFWIGGAVLQGAEPPPLSWCADQRCLVRLGVLGAAGRAGVRAMMSIPLADKATKTYIRTL